MGWEDCFDFAQGEFTKPDTKAREIWRVLRDGGSFVYCCWEEQEDLSWMEEEVIRYCPEILEDPEYLKQRPIGTAYEDADGYRIILPAAGFGEIEVFRETMTFVSTDEEEWWRMMLHMGWDLFTNRMEQDDPDLFETVKTAIFLDLQPHKQPDGIHFEKKVFFVRCVK